MGGTADAHPFRLRLGLYLMTWVWTQFALALKHSEQHFLSGQ